MKDYFVHRFKDFLWFALAAGIGALTGILFFGIGDSYAIMFKAMALGYLVSEIIHFSNWLRNNKKNEKQS